MYQSFWRVLEAFYWLYLVFYIASTTGFIIILHHPKGELPINLLVTFVRFQGLFDVLFLHFTPQTKSAILEKRGRIRPVRFNPGDLISAIVNLFIARSRLRLVILANGEDYKQMFLFYDANTFSFWIIFMLPVSSCVRSFRPGPYPSLSAALVRLRPLLK